MNNKSLNNLLIKEFPFLQTEFQEEINWQEGINTGSHIVFGDVLTPYLIKCIKEKKIKDIINVFGFIETLLLQNDTYSNEVICFSVLENIMYLIDDNLLYNYLGEQTKTAIQQLKNQDC